MSDEAAQLELLRAYLRAQDCACPGCGYNLRDLTSAVCPECGDALTLRLALEEPRLRSWIAGLVGLAAGLGFNALLLVYITLMLAREGLTRIDRLMEGFVIHNVGGAIIEGVLVMLWIRKRPLIRRQRPSVRFWLVMACWAMALLNVLVFTFVIDP